MFISLFSSTVQAAESYVTKLDRLFAAPKFSHTTLAISLYHLSSERLLYARHHHQAVVPASTIKWLTAIAAVEHFGWDHRFNTSLVSTGPIVDGVLNGDVVIVAGGDPTFSSEVLVHWAKRLKTEKGVHTIRGKVRVDTSIFADASLGKGWAWDDLSFRYAAPISALSMDLNVNWFSGYAPKARNKKAKFYGGRMTNCFRYIPTKAALSRPYLERKLGQSVIVGHGLGRVRAGKAKARFTVPDPPSCAQIVLDEALRKEKVTIEEKYIATASAQQQIFRQKSPPLSELLRVMLKTSQNLYAELIVRALDPRNQGKNFAGAKQVLKKVLTRAKVAKGSFRLADGSGLSRYNLLSTNALTQLSRYASQQPYFDRLLSLLPQAGIDGTLARRMAYGKAKGRVYGKTGSMSNIRNIVGYIKSADNELLAFSILFTGMLQPQSEGIRLQDAVMSTIAASSIRKDRCWRKRWWQRKSSFQRRCGADRIQK